MSWICDQGPCLGIANPKWLPTCDSHLSQCPCVSLAEERDALVTCLRWEAEAVLKPVLVCPQARDVAHLDGGAWCVLASTRNPNMTDEQEDMWIWWGLTYRFTGIFHRFQKVSPRSQTCHLSERKKWNSFSICSKTPETPPCQMRLYCSYK